MARSSHTNIVCRDPEGLSAFYFEVLGCSLSGPTRELSGECLARGIGLAGASIHGVHLRLPGVGEDTLTLELFALEPAGVPGDPDVNRAG